MQTELQRKATVPCASCGRLNRVDLARAADRPRCGACGQPIPLDRPLRLTDAAFDRVLADSPVPVLVDFYADWCGPCRMMAPVFEELAGEYAGRVLFAKMNVDDNAEIPSKFSTFSIPTLIMFKNGEAVDRTVGFTGKSGIAAGIDSLL